MKKSMLLFLTIGCLFPLTSSPVSLKYAEGPADLPAIQIHSHTPDAAFWYLSKNGAAKNFFHGHGKMVHITIKAGEGTGQPPKVLVQEKKLNNEGCYDIVIDEHHKVTFKHRSHECNQ